MTADQTLAAVRAVVEDYTAHRSIAGNCMERIASLLADTQPAAAPSGASDGVEVRDRQDGIEMVARFRKAVFELDARDPDTHAEMIEAQVALVSALAALSTPAAVSEAAIEAAADAHAVDNYASVITSTAFKYGARWAIAALTQPAAAAPSGASDAFETWWKKEGQFCRAGGGDYEKTFAFRAWEAARPAEKQITDKQILDAATACFPRWREDIQERFVLEVVRAALAHPSGAPKVTDDMRALADYYLHAKQPTPEEVAAEQVTDEEMAPRVERLHAAMAELRASEAPAQTKVEAPNGVDYDPETDEIALAYPVEARAGLTEIDRLRACLQWYADGNHFILSDESEWDTVSDEPQNWYCDSFGTATVEDGSVAKAVLNGAIMTPDDPDVLFVMPAAIEAAGGTGT